MRKINPKRITYYGITLSVLLFLHYTSLISPLEGLLIKLLNPALDKFYATSSSVRIAYNQQTEKRDLASLVRELSSRANRLTEENARLKMLEDENKTLRNYLQFLTNKQKKYLMANVVSRGEIDAASQSLTIDKGTKEGLYPGLAVVSSDGNVVGKIIESKDYISEVCLVTSNRCQFASAIQNKDKTIGVSQGDLGLTIKMGFIPQSEVVKVGDIVVTSGLEKNIARGLVVGQVDEVRNETNELWQQARIEPLTSFEDIVVVAVLLP